MAPGDEEEPAETAEDVEDWIKEILECGVWMANKLKKGRSVRRRMSTLSLTTISHNDNPPSTVPSRDDDNLRTIQDYLETLSFPSAVSIQERTRLVKCACHFFVQGNRLWRKESAGRHQLVIFGLDQMRILRETHDQLGHKGLYPT
jgi:hypothetical protein